MKEKAVVIYSGGMDSFTMLNEVLQSYDVSALSFNYGQRHSKELVYAANFAKEKGIPHTVVDLTNLTSLISNSALTGGIAVPHGHYESESMKLTVVPNRNMIMLSIAVGHAVNIGALKVFYGAHGGDHAIYPDCRPEFVGAMNSVTRIANFQPVDIVAPYLNINKTGILTRGLALGLDYSKSWTCYEGGKNACGKCGSCQERLEAFRVNNVIDPLFYDTDIKSVKVS